MYGPRLATFLLIIGLINTCAVSQNQVSAETMMDLDKSSPKAVDVYGGDAHGLWDGQASLEDVIEKVFDAIEMDDLGAVKVAIKHGFDPSLHLDKEGELAFHYAASIGALEICKFFVEKLKLDVDMRHSDGSTPFIVAAWHGHKEVADYLISKGADIHNRCYNGWNAVFGAVNWNEFLDIPEYEGEWTPLKLAAARGQAHIVDYLLKNGANPHFRGKSGRSPQAIAREKGFHLIAKRLITEEELFDRNFKSQSSHNHEEL